MKDKIAGAGLVLLLIGAAMMDSDSIAIPLAIMTISFALIGAAAYLEWKEELYGKKLHRSLRRSYERVNGKEKIC